MKWIISFTKTQLICKGHSIGTTFIDGIKLMNVLAFFHQCKKTHCYMCYHFGFYFKKVHEN